MRIAFKSLTLASACAAFSFAIVEVCPAHAAILTWGLTFTSGGVEVGTGEFSYDTDKVAVVRTPAAYTNGYIAGKDDPLRSDFVPPFPGLWNVTKYANPIESFIARLPGRDWSLLGLSWFDPFTPSVFGSISCTSTGCGVSGQLFGGSPTGQAPGQFALYGASLQDDGSYTGSFVSAPLPFSPNSLISGTWSATAVPEPTTIAGVVIFGVGYLAARRRSR